MTKLVSPYKTSLDPGNAYWMARIANQVYQTLSDDNQLPNEQGILDNLKSEDDNFLSVIGVDKNSAQAAIVEHRDYICLAFRGTDEIADWLNNINIFSTKALFGNFHSGFWQSVEDIWQALTVHLNKLQDVVKQFAFITGHSLGNGYNSCSSFYSRR